MKHLSILRLWLALLMVNLLFVAGCGESGSSNADNVLRTPNGPTQGIALGKVVNTAGAPLVGVNVTILGQLLKTDANGNVTAPVPANQNTVITVQSPTYATGYVVVNPGPGLTHLFQVTLKGVRTVAGLNATVAQTVADNRADGLNGSVTLQANSVVNAQGGLVSPVTVEITTVVPSDARFAETFPGMFSGIPTGGAAGPIESYGFIDVTLKDAAGNPVNLNPNLPAALVIPIDPAHDPGTATVPLWSLNKTTGVWAQEGVATRDTTVVPNVYRANVTHFTPYNLDKYFAGGALRVVTVQGNDNTTPVPGVQVTIESFNTSTNGTWRGVLFTGADGTADFRIPEGFLIVTAVKGKLTGGGHLDRPVSPWKIPMN